MVEKVTLFYKGQSIKLSWTSQSDQHFRIDLNDFYAKAFERFEIEFAENISLFRNHDYTWIPLSQSNIAGTFSPKAVQFQSGIYMQPNCNHFVWEIASANPKKIICHLNGTNVNPMVNYLTETNIKKISLGNQPNAIPHYELLFSSKGIVELSRSKIPFVATACFTDHCDFDTLESIQKQRMFFKA